VLDRPPTRPRPPVRPPAYAPDFRGAAVRYLAQGRTAGGMRSAAPAEAARLAGLCGLTQAEAEGFLLAIADAMDVIAAAGIAAGDCRDLLSWPPEFTARVLAETAGSTAAA
jgi:hypothetical protein